VANCFATDQSNAFVEASLGDCCCQHQSMRIQSRQCRNPIRVRIAAVSSVSVAYPKQIVRQKDGYESTADQAYRLRNPKRIDCGIKRIGCVLQSESTAVSTVSVA
jgi:hypothetical protein